MPGPLRRRNAASPAASASDYAPPADAPADDIRPRRGRASAPVAAPVFKYPADSLEDADRDVLFRLADEEGLDPSIEDIDEIFDLLTAIVVEPAPEPAAEPASARRRGRAGAAEEPEEAPVARGRGRRTEPAEEEAPVARGRGRRAAPAEDDAPPARGRERRNTADTEEPGDAPKRAGGKAGFAAYAKVKATTASYEKTWKPKMDVDSIVKFMDPEGPFDTYSEHNLFNSVIKTGQRTFVCIEGSGTDCPLCAVGSEKKAVALFNVLVLDPDDPDADPEYHVLEAKPDLAGQIEALSKERALGGDLTVGSASMTAYEKANGFTSYKVLHVKDRDMEEDWGLAPLTSAEVEEFADKRKGDDFVKYSSLTRMNEAATALTKG